MNCGRLAITNLCVQTFWKKKEGAVFSLPLISARTSSCVSYCSSHADPVEYSHHSVSACPAKWLLHSTASWPKPLSNKTVRLPSV